MPNLSIKSDKWIRRMAEQRGMIGQFEPEREGYITLKLSNTTPLLRV